MKSDIATRMAEFVATHIKEQKPVASQNIMETNIKYFTDDSVEGRMKAGLAEQMILGEMSAIIEEAVNSGDETKITDIRKAFWQNIMGENLEDHSAESPFEDDLSDITDEISLLKKSKPEVVRKGPTVITVTKQDKDKDITKKGSITVEGNITKEQVQEMIDAAVKPLQEEISQLKKEKEEQAKKIEELKAKGSEVWKKNQELKTKITKLETENKELQAKGCNKTITDLKDRLKQAGEMFMNLKNTTDTERETARQKITELEGEISELKKNTGENLGVADISKYEAAIADYENQIKTKETKISELSEEVATLKKARTAIDVSKYESIIEDLTGAVKKKDKEIEDSINIIKKQDADIVKLQDEIEELRQGIVTEDKRESSAAIFDLLISAIGKKIMSCVRGFFSWLLKEEKAVA